MEIKSIPSLPVKLFIFVILTISQCQLLFANNNLQVTAHPAIRYQIIDGFGASDAWRAQFVGKSWPLEKRNRIADLLFSRDFDESGNPKGIGLSIWRFYLSAGTAEQGVDSDIRNPWRRGECFLNADGSYDWDKFKGQRWFLQAARDRGVKHFLIFSNAAPVHLSQNGKGYSNKGNIHFNIKPGYMDDYAEYLVEVIDHFNREGICFNYLSPVNEPQWNWDEPGQEGTPALNEEIYTLVRCLSNGLSEKGLRTRIVIGEAGTIGHAAISMASIGKKSDGRDDQARFFFDKKSRFYIGDMPCIEKIISAHSYHTVWPIDKQINYRRKVHEAIKQVNPDLGYWMSEYCILQKNDEIGSGGGRDLTMKTALYVARIIHNDLTLCHAKSWQWWTAITQCNYKDGLVYLDDGSRDESGRMGGHVKSLQYDGVIRESKLLWVLGNYARFIRPGMVRIECSISEKQSIENGLLVSAYHDVKTNKLVYVLTNLSRQEKVIHLGSNKKVQTYTTSDDHNLKFVMQNISKITIPKRSVVTVINKAK